MAKVLTLSIDGRNVEIENRFTILVSTATIGGSLDNTDYIYICSGTFTFTFPTAVGNRNRYSLINEGTGVITAVFTAGQNANTLLQ